MGSMEKIPQEKGEATGFYRHDPEAFGPEAAKVGETIAKGEWKPEEVKEAIERMKETGKAETDIRYGKKE